ncbi:MAG: hypothetical protein NT062_21775 [Proteobacteria bacterium]|nr:hypothetical protein [Pseudomonadota bacterium]
MRYELPDAVAAHVATCAQPTLVFDRARLEANARVIAEAAHASGITTLFALKSFPHPDVVAIARAAFDGFDVASVGEARVAHGARIVSIADPSGRTREVDAARVIVSCETVAQVVAAPAHAEIAIRLSASAGGRDPAIGAILDGNGHRRSRFGLDVGATRGAAIAAMVAAANGRPVGVHVHHGAVTATSAARFVATIEAALAGLELAPRFVNLGGAWHGIADDALAGVLATVRAAIPRATELVIEPGRVVARGAGFATGRVTSVRTVDDRALAVADLSRICHLRWSPVELVARPPAAGGTPVLLVGPTCFEEDVIGEWIVEPDSLAIASRIVVRDVTGYAVAWNTGFAGVAPADVHVG